MKDPAFWLAVGKIIWIDVLLSGDNALVIALPVAGCRPNCVFGEWSSAPALRSCFRIIFAGIVAT